MGINEWGNGGGKGEKKKDNILQHLDWNPIIRFDALILIAFSVKWKKLMNKKQQEKQIKEQK